MDMSVAIKRGNGLCGLAEDREALRRRAEQIADILANMRADHEESYRACIGKLGRLIGENERLRAQVERLEQQQNGSAGMMPFLGRELRAGLKAQVVWC